MPTSADSGCHVVSATDPHGRFLGFLDRILSLHGNFKRIKALGLSLSKGNETQRSTNEGDYISESSTSPDASNTSFEVSCINAVKKKTPWLESPSELYRPRDRCLSAKFVATFADSGFHAASVTVPYGRILGFLDRSR
jgi:hypothetical protein